MGCSYKNYFDAIYKSSLLYQTITVFISKGNKSKCESFIYHSLHALGLTLRENSFMVFFEVIERSRPSVFIRLKKSVKSVVVVPHVLSNYKQYSQALKWLKLSCLIRGNKEPMVLRLQSECLSLYLNRSSFILLKKREVYDCATNSRLNTHYRW